MRLGGGDDTHHHGLFAGLSAATAGVIIAGIGLWALWSRIAGQLGVAFLIAMWIVLMSGCAIAVAGAGHVWVGLLGRALRLRQAAAAPQHVTAQVIPAATIGSGPEGGALPGAAVPALETPALPQLEAGPGGDHYHFHGREAVEAAMRALARGDTP